MAIARSADALLQEMRNLHTKQAETVRELRAGASHDPQWVGQIAVAALDQVTDLAAIVGALLTTVAALASSVGVESLVNGPGIDLGDSLPEQDAPIPRLRLVDDDAPPGDEN